MTPKQLEDFISMYRYIDSEYRENASDRIEKICSDYSLIIHNLTEVIFGSIKTDILEDYIFGELDISFDKLCQYLEI